MITKPAGITEARRPKHPHNQDLKPQLYLGATDQRDLMLSKTTQYPTRRSVSKEKKKYTTAQNHWLNIKLSDICVFYPFFPETTSVLMTMGYFRCRTKMASKMRRMGSSSARFQEVQDNIFINTFAAKSKKWGFRSYNRYWRGFILGRRGVFSLAHSLNLAVMSACLQWESYARSHSSNETNFMHMFSLCENSLIALVNLSFN